MDGKPKKLLKQNKIMKKTKVLVFAALLTGGVCMQAQEAALPKQIKIGKERVKARRELRLPEIDGYQLLKCDFHVHTIFSDGIVWPTLRVQEAWEEGREAVLQSQIRKKLEKGKSLREIADELETEEGEIRRLIESIEQAEEE